MSGHWPAMADGQMPTWALTDTELSREMGNASGERLAALRTEREQRDALRASLACIRIDDN